MRRRRLAWLLTLVLAMELAALCCAGVHLGCHGGMHADRCPVCRLALADRGAARLLPALCLALVAAICFAPRRFHGPLLPSVFTPVTRRVRLND